MFIAKRVRITVEALIVAEVRSDCKPDHWGRDAKPFTRISLDKDGVFVVEDWRKLTELEIALLMKQGAGEEN